MTDNEIRSVFDQSENHYIKSGDTFFKQGDYSDSMFIILLGRVLIQVTKQDGKQQNLNVLNQGDHFGELSLITGGTRTATVTAMMDTTVLKIRKSQFKQLIHGIPAFSFNISNTISVWLQKELEGKPTRHTLGIIGIIHSTAGIQSITQSFCYQITQWLTSKGKTIEIFTDRIDYWHNKQSNDDQLKQLHFITKDSKSLKTTLQHLSLSEADKQSDHIIFDLCIDANTDTNEQKLIAKLLNQCEHIWWFQCPSLAKINPSFTLLYNSLIQHQSTLSKKIQLTWLHSSIPTKAIRQWREVKHQPTLKHNDMHCHYDPKTSQLRKQDLARFYHVIMGVQLGLALGGGGARSLAHIGVLAALDENDIVFDRIAGTSGGAIISAFYAAGFSLQMILDLFKEEMTPPKWMRFIPYATRWHLMSLFRFGLLEQRFRRYLQDQQIEQLLIPTHMVSADLISGNEVIRSTGNIVDGILESINHPLLGKPIYRDGLSLVDGGVLNNVPSSVLRQQQCDFVVSVDVGAKISETFGKNGCNTLKSEMKKVSYLGTLNRVLEIRSNGLEKTYKNHSDFLIQPDASQYPFDDFTYGEELFKIGFDATMEVMPELKQCYAEFLRI